MPAFKTHADAHGHDGTNNEKSRSASAPRAAPGHPRRRCAAPHVLPLHPAAGTTPTVPLLVARRARYPPARLPYAAVHSRRPLSPSRRAAGCSLPRRSEPMSWPLSCSVGSSATPMTRPARCSRPANARGRAADGQRSGCASAQRLFGTRKALPTHGRCAPRWLSSIGARHLAHPALDKVSIERVGVRVDADGYGLWAPQRKVTTQRASAPCGQTAPLRSASGRCVMRLS